MTSQLPVDTHYEVVINRAKFDVCTPSSIRGIKTDKHTDRFTIRLAGSADVARRASFSNFGVKNIPSAGQACFTHHAPVWTETIKLCFFFMHIHNSCIPSYDHLIVLTKTANAYKQRILPQTITKSCKKI